MNIQVLPQDEDKFQEVLEALKPLGVEVVTGTDEPLVTALFYLARMNSKLDNMGQLKHLHKMQTAAHALEKAAQQQQKYYDYLLGEQQYRTWRADRYYHAIKQRVKIDDSFTSYSAYMSLKEILSLFKGKLTEEEYQEELDKLNQIE